MGNYFFAQKKETHVMSSKEKLLEKFDEQHRIWHETSHRELENEIAKCYKNVKKLEEENNKLHEALDGVYAAGQMKRGTRRARKSRSHK